MKKILMVLALASFAAPGAYACQVSQAHIKGTIAGNDIKGKVCYIVVELTEVKFPPNCGLTGLRVGQEVKLRTELNERNAPTTKAPWKVPCMP